MKRLIAVSLIVAATVAGACDNGGSSSTTAPTAPSTIVTFSGTVPVGGFDPQYFTVTQTGELDITLTAAGPPPTITMGIGVGNGTAATGCVIPTGDYVVEPAGSVAQLSGTSSPGSYCVEIFDIGNDAGPISYTVVVSHT